MEPLSSAAMIPPDGHTVDCTPMHARWLVERKRRWPIAALVVLGAWLAVYAALAGAGREAARRSLPASDASVLDLAPAPLPESENAAVIWRRAFGLIDALKEGEDGHRIELELKSLGSREDDGLTAEDLAKYEGIFQLAASAARLERCNWGIDYSAKPLPEPLNHFTLGTIGSLRARRAELAGAAGDWLLVEEDVRIILTAARHMQGDPIVVCYAAGIGLDRRAMEAIRGALSGPAAPPAETVGKLRAMLRNRISSLAPLVPFLEADRKVNLRGIDLAGAGELGGLGIRLEGGTPERFPLLLHPYATIYAWDRAFYDRWMGRIIAEIEASDHWEKLPVFSEIEQVYYSGRIENRVARIGRGLIGTPEIAARESSKHLARLRTALAALAALERRLGPGGAWPGSLEDLDLSADERTDPFSRERAPLRHRELSDGSFAVWSVGENGVGLDEEDLEQRIDDGKVIGFRVRVPGGESDAREE